MKTLTIIGGPHHGKWVTVSSGMRFIELPEPVEPSYSIGDAINTGFNNCLYIRKKCFHRDSYGDEPYTFEAFIYNQLSDAEVSKLICEG